MIKAGTLVMGIAVVHCAVGVGLAKAPLLEIAAQGFVGAVEADLERIAVFWFMFFGFLLLLLGQALRAWERVARLPAGVGYGLGALCLAGAIMIPASGFWLGLVPAALILHRWYRPAAPSPTH